MVCFLIFRLRLPVQCCRILHQIDKLRVPLNENSVRFKYVLVIGRNAEKDNSEKRRAMFAEKSDNDIRVMTYDSLVG